MTMSVHRKVRVSHAHLRHTLPQVEGVRPLRILVAQDDAGARQALQETLGSLGYGCVVARDGFEAWEQHRAEAADLIVSAYRLPGVSGPDLCRKARAADRIGRYTHFILTVGPDDAPGVDPFATSADDCLVMPIEVDVLRGRLASVSRIHDVMRARDDENAALRQASQKAFHMARVDPLTGVGNRLRMDEDVAVVWAQAGRYGRRHCVALCDIDWFKSYNDTYGHAAGDDVLRRLAETMRAGLRRGDVVYRYGGDEFVVLLPEQSASEACAAMDRVRREVDRLAIATPARGGILTMSVGVSELRAGDEHPRHWLARADRALYEAKAHGRDQVRVVDEDGVRQPA